MVRCLQSADCPCDHCCVSHHVRAGQAAGCAASVFVCRQRRQEASDSPMGSRRSVTILTLSRQSRRRSESCQRSPTDAPRLCFGFAFRAVAISREDVLSSTYGKVGSAYGIRTRVTAVRGRRPGPLDECAKDAGDAEDTGGICRGQAHLTHEGGWAFPGAAVVGERRGSGRRGGLGRAPGLQSFRVDRSTRCLARGQAPTTRDARFARPVTRA